MAGLGSRAPASRQPLLYLGALAVGVVLAIVAAMLLNNGTGGLASSTPSPGPAGTGIAVASEGPITSGEPSLEPGASSQTPTAGTPTSQPTAVVTPAPSKTPKPTPVPTPRPTVAPSPTASTKPKIDSFTANPNFITTCDGGTSVTLTWATTNATEVSIAIDPQGDSPLNHIYVSGQPLDGSTDVPYACNPPNTNPNTGDKYHEYVVIARKGTAYVWRSIYVYIHPVT